MIRAAVAAFACAARVGRAATDARNARDDGTREIALINPGFEAPLTPAGFPQGWTPIQHAGDDAYAFTLDTTVRRSGLRSLRITNRGSEPFGAIMQTLRDPTLRGRTVRFSAWLRTDSASGNGFGGGGALNVQAMRNGTPIAYDRMRGRAIGGTSDWQRCTVTLTVPADSDALEVGAMLYGRGTLWFDDATLEVATR